mmetsp:Transcript_24190/g.69820  ORF Transcript_24190/g.69820 Transcript_24190/m.69820 type:complete len:202 (-) Transcript_24190:1795-2400(-)
MSALAADRLERQPLPLKLLELPLQRYQLVVLHGHSLGELLAPAPVRLSDSERATILWLALGHLRDVNRDPVHAQEDCHLHLCHVAQGPRRALFLDLGVPEEALQLGPAHVREGRQEVLPRNEAGHLLDLCLQVGVRDPDLPVPELVKQASHRHPHGLALPRQLPHLHVHVHDDGQDHVQHQQHQQHHKGPDPNSDCQRVLL